MTDQATAASMMERVTPNVFTNTKLRGCNPSFVVTSDGVVCIDTPQLPTKAVAMRAAAEAHGSIRYLINTENHVDHIFGNYWYRGAGEIVNHQALWDIFMDPKAALDPNTVKGMDGLMTEAVNLKYMSRVLTPAELAEFVQVPLK